jgi:nitroreductase
VEFVETARARRMVRAFRDDPVDPDTVDGILDLARRAPSAGNTQGTELLLVDDADTRARFWDAVFPQRTDAFRWPAIFSAPVIVVPCASRDAYLDRYAEVDKGWDDRNPDRWCAPYWDIDSGMVVMTMLLAAVDAGLGGLFFGWAPANTPSLRAAFDIPERFSPIGAVALGHPAPDTPSPSLARGRRDLADVVHRGRW